MSAVADRLIFSNETSATIDDELEYIKTYLHIDHCDEDELLLDLAQAAKESADAFLNNPFVDDAGVELDIPKAVRIWCLEFIARGYEQRQNGLQAESASGIGAKTYGELSFDSIYRFRCYPGL